MKSDHSVKLHAGIAVIDGTVCEIEDVRLIGVIGDGANGVVFDAVDLILNRPVAAKIWWPRLPIPSERVRARALKEGRKAAALRHENIAVVYRFGMCAEYVPFVIMERVIGVPLDEITASEKFGRERTLDLWIQISQATKYAHSQGVYHGDLHGGNILISERRAVLIDFGSSIISGRRVHTAKREAKLLLKLPTVLFGVHSPPRLRAEVVDRLVPESALEVANSVVDVLYNEAKLPEELIRNDDWSIRNVLFGISVGLCSAPAFDFLAYIQRIEARLPQALHRLWFWSGLAHQIAAEYRNVAAPIPKSLAPDEPEIYPELLALEYDALSRLRYGGFNSSRPPSPGAQSDRRCVGAISKHIRAEGGRSRVGSARNRRV